MFAYRALLVTTLVAVLSCHVTAQSLGPPSGASGPPPSGGTGGGGSGGPDMSGYAVKFTFDPSTTCGITRATSMLNAFVDTTNNLLMVYGSGCPPYDWTSQSTPNTPGMTCTQMTTYLNPRFNNVTTPVGGHLFKNGSGYNLSPLGSLGVSVVGVPIFSNSDANDLDAYINERVSFDTCNGHPSNDGEYHYHAQPKPGCVYNDTTGVHSPLFGIMVDGIPIYGTLGDNGTVPTDLKNAMDTLTSLTPFTTTTYNQITLTHIPLIA